VNTCQCVRMERRQLKRYYSGVNTIDWLLDSDPAISWQAMRDLTDASPAAITAERARVTREGIGAEILTRQKSDGSWHRTDAPVWLPTLFTLLLLRATGVDRTEPAVESAVTRLEASLRWNDSSYWELRSAEFGGNRFFEGEEEPCINGGILALGAYFGRPAESLARRLVGERLGDGGWNCEAPKSPRSSFHTTICVLEGLLEYERAVGSAPQIAAARRRGEEYLLERGLFRRRSTAEVANSAFLELAFPPRYHYDILPCARLLQGRRCPARRSRQRCRASRQEQAAGRRQMAPRSRLRRGARHSGRRIRG
jgi:hypothetical protein